MNNYFLNYCKKLWYFIAWKTMTLVYGIHVLSCWISYKRNPVLENRTKYIVNKNWWVNQLRK